MYEITLKGTAYDSGVQQGKAYAILMRELFSQCSVWLGNMSQDRVAEIRNTMVRSIREIYPKMIEELEGIAAGSGMPFEDVCTLNFVSAIGALNGCTNLIALKTDEGPALAKTSDIGNDYAYYSVQQVVLENGASYLAVGWIGCLWAEVGINSAGLAVGQGSGPILPGQDGEGIPTLEYPRVILECCNSVEEAIRFCQDTPMAGKGLNIAMVDKRGQAAVVEKSGNRSAVRRPLQNGDHTVTGAVLDGVFCTNHFLEPAMQGLKALEIPGIPPVTENSQKRLVNVSKFFSETPHPSVKDLISLLNTGLEANGILQDKYPEITTHFAYVLLPVKREMRISRGIPYQGTDFSAYRL